VAANWLGSTIAEVDYYTGRVVRIPGLRWPPVTWGTDVDSPEWKKIIGAVAPALATALGGPLAGAAVATLSAAVLGKPDGSEAEIAAAVASGGPDTVRALQQAEAEFLLEMRRIDLDVEKLHQVDRASARGREVSAADSWTPRALAGAVTAGFFGVLAWLLMNGMPATGGEALLVMLGALGSAWGAVVQYYFGSSAGSARKDDILRRA
jgi:hypothetical protein